MRKFINSYSVSLVVIVFGGILTAIAFEQYYESITFRSNNLVVYDYKIAWVSAALMIAGLITLTINDIFKKP